MKQTKNIPITRGLLLLVVALGLGGLLSSLPGCNRVKRERWISEMKKKTPDAFCKDGTYFRQCFKIGRATCVAVAREKVSACLEKLRSKIPKQLKQPDQGREWGSKVGFCAGQAFELQLLDKRINSAKCRDPNAWR